MTDTEFKDTYDIAIRNDLPISTKASFKLSRPDILRRNLNTKSIRIQKMYLNNTYLAQFIPDRVTDLSYFAINPNAVTNNFINNSLTVNSLAYYITIRKLDNSVSETIFIRHVPENPTLPVPPAPILSDTSYYMNTYYWYHDITDFLSVLQNSIVACATALGIPTLNVQFIFTGNNFSLLIDQSFFTTWQIEFSINLMNLFPFKSKYNTIYPPNAILIPGGLLVDNNLLPLNCVVYDTIFPWSEILVTTEQMGLNPTKFLGNAELKNNIQNPIYTNTILAYNIQGNNLLVYNFYEYVNNYESEYVNFYIDEVNTDIFDIAINLRLKNNIVVPMYLNYKESLKLTFEIKMVQ